MKKQSLLSSLNDKSLDAAHQTTGALANKLKAENHKPKKVTVIPAEYMEGGTQVLRIPTPLHKLLKMHAVDKDSDIQTKGAEAIYKMMVAEGIIKK